MLRSRPSRGPSPPGGPGPPPNPDQTLWGALSSPPHPPEGLWDPNPPPSKVSRPRSRNDSSDARASHRGRSNLPLDARMINLNSKAAREAHEAAMAGLPYTVRLEVCLACLDLIFVFWHFGLKCAPIK